MKRLRLLFRDQSDLCSSYLGCQFCYNLKSCVLSSLYTSSRCLANGMFEHSFSSAETQNAAAQDNINDSEEIANVPKHLQDHNLWLNTEQYDGYSKTYLEPFMTYDAENDNMKYKSISDMYNNIGVYDGERKTPLNECLELVHSLYGMIAEELQELHDNPLHKEFHIKMEKIKNDREKIAHALDEIYSSLHPTMKTIFDALLVRRYYHLTDWIIYVEHKRDELFRKLSPEMIEDIMRKKSVAEGYMQRLRKLGDFINNEEPLAGLLTTNTMHDKSYGASHNELSEFSDKELAILRQKAKYFRKMARYGEIHAHSNKGSL